MSVLFVVFIPVEEFTGESDNNVPSDLGDASDGKTGNSVKEGNNKNTGVISGESNEGERDTTGERGQVSADQSTEPILGGRESADQSTGPIPGGQESAYSEELAESDFQESIPLLSPQNSSPHSACGQPDTGKRPSDIEEGGGLEQSLKQDTESKFKVEVVTEDENSASLPKRESESKFKVEVVTEDENLPSLPKGESEPSCRGTEGSVVSEGGKSEVGEAGGKSGVSFQLSTGIELETEFISVEQVLQSVLNDLDIKTDTWTESDDNNFWQVTFVVEKEDIDVILDRLSYYGIGHMTNTSVSIFPSSYYQCGRDKPSKEDPLPASTKSLKGDPEEKNNFINSVKARLTVAQVVEAVKTNSRLTFDFVILIILASVIAVLGLVENSSVILVASMLVSPLMGPILGVTFGIVVQNKPLFRLGLCNEAIGLCLCLVVGFLFGLVVSAVNHNGSHWGATSDWPTSEMQARGVLRSLWVGLFVALPSGAGVAFSILGGNVGSLVGVAISASLLPPAVNAGMLWAYGFVSLMKPPQFVTSDLNPLELNLTQNSLLNATQSPLPSPTPPDCGSLQDNTYVFHYSCHMTSEAFLLGTVSLTLTLLNILCIFAMGVAVLKIKEVAPRTAIADGTDKFWKSDIQVARETYKTLKTSSPSYNEFSNLARRLGQEQKDKALQLEMADVVESITDDDDFKTIQARLIVKPHIKVNEIFQHKSNHYITLGPASIQRQRPVTIATEPSSPMPSSPEPWQQTWMGLRHRKQPGLDLMSKSADVLHSTKNPFIFPKPGNVGKGKRRLRDGKHSPSSQSVDQTDATTKLAPSVSSGRFEITTVPEERRGSLVSNMSLKNSKPPDRGQVTASKTRPTRSGAGLTGGGPITTASEKEDGKCGKVVEEGGAIKFVV